MGYHSPKQTAGAVPAMALDKKQAMPPTFIPPYNDNYKFRGEADVFHHLHQTLPDEATVFTNVRIPDPENPHQNPIYRREADAIIAFPQGVIVVVEIKGGVLKSVKIKMQDGKEEEWMAASRQVDEEGEELYRLEHPSRQADTLRDDLRDFLRASMDKAGGEGVDKLKIWSITAMPHTHHDDRPKNKRYAQYVFCGERCDEIGERLSTISESRKKNQNFLEVIKSINNLC